MTVLNRDLVVVIKFVASCITAGFLIFFISALSGEDLIKNQKTIANMRSGPGRRRPASRLTGVGPGP